MLTRHSPVGRLTNKVVQNLCSDRRRSSSSGRSSSRRSSGSSGSSHETMVKKMQECLGNDSTANQELGWESLWSDGITPWDINMPTPVLKAELRQNTPPVNHSCYPKPPHCYNMLIPGCGSGHDLLTMSQFQEQWKKEGRIHDDSNVLGLDISLTSLEHAKRTLLKAATTATVANNNNKNNHNQNKEKAVVTSTTSSNNVTLVHGDFLNCNTWKPIFNNSQVHHCNDHIAFQEERFDLIFDYTFFVALPLHLRSHWGKTMALLLKPNTGRLLTLMFPVLPADSLTMEGPPYPVTIEDYRRVLEPNGVVMDSEPFESQHTIEPRKGKEYVCWWRREGISRL